MPGTIYRVDELRKAVNAGRQPFFLTDGEHAALRYLDRSPVRGGVLTPVYMGLLVPAWTQRETWVGAGSWTPHFDARLQQVEQLFSGRLSRTAGGGARAAVGRALAVVGLPRARGHRAAGGARDRARAALRLRAGVGGPMRRLAAGVALAGPTALAFFSGGFFDEPRLWAGLVACVLLVVAALTSPLPRSPWPWVAPVAIALLAGWAWLSTGWAPLDGVAIADAQRVALYAVALLAGTLLLPALPRAVEPALGLGTLVVVGYGLSGRLLPGLVHLDASQTALGRLEQPLTYWNAMGALAGIGFVLAARVMADPARPPWLRALLGAATAPLGLGVVLTFSRGTLLALAVGLAVLCLVAPARAQVRAVALALAATVVAGGAGMALTGVRTLDGSLGSREAQGAGLLVLLALLMAGLALLARREPPAGVVRHAVPVALAGAGAVVLVGIALALSGAAPEAGTPAAGRIRRGSPRRSRTATRTGRSRCARSPTIRSTASAPAASGSSGGASARSPTPRRTRIRCTSRRPPSSGSSGCCCSAWRSPAW